jgi:tRNA1Val (adenine37-N6)-methyltransferase
MLIYTIFSYVIYMSSREVKMSNNYFKFKQFTVHQEHVAFKITTDSVLLGAWADLNGCRSVLDIGTGTGIISLMAAQRSGAQIVAIEPDPGSYMQAGLNISASPWHDRITVLNNAVQDYFPGSNLLFDTIITNPPFFIDSLPNPEAAKARARHSLTLSHSELVTAALRLLSDEGILQLVLPVAEAELFTVMAAEAGLYCRRRLTVRPTPSLPPARLLMTLGRVRSSIEESTLVIEKGGRHHYSDEYVSLTKDFYLKF